MTSAKGKAKTAAALPETVAEPHDGHDLRQLLLTLYLKNNPQLKHQVFIYTYKGVTHESSNPFQYVSGELGSEVKKSLILQNMPAGEMIQAFIVPTANHAKDGSYEIENTVIYGNKVGVLIEIGLDNERIDRSEKYRQFAGLADAMLRQFV